MKDVIGLNCFRILLIVLAMRLSMIEATTVYHYALDTHDRSQYELIWEKEKTKPFDELILSWNAKRPKGSSEIMFYVSIKTNSWSKPLPYALWSSISQRTFEDIDHDSQVKSYQDAIEVCNEKKATGFKIFVRSPQKNPLETIRSLHVSLHNAQDFTGQEARGNYHTLPKKLVHLNIDGISQIALPHERNMHLCSPTATCSVTRYLAKNDSINPCTFAKRSHDSGFDIYGNWVFNVAESSSYLDKKWIAYVTRLDSFDAIIQNLELEIPSVVSIRGPLIRSASEYASGHLVAVIGFDGNTDEIICMDPAFNHDYQTICRYPANDFIQAWERRGNLTYFYSKDSTH